MKGVRITIMFRNKDIISAHKFCANNMASLRKDKVCGCFYCMKIFSSDKIESYIEENWDTAICPYCGIDSVIGESSGYPITNDFLQQMKTYWFES